MKTLNITIISILLIITSSCNDRNLMSYYYPTNKDQVKIYKYVDPNAEDSEEYWKVTMDKDQNTIFTESFNESFVLYNSFYEQITSDEAILLKYSDYKLSKNGTYLETKSDVIRDKVYHKDINNSYSYAVEYRNEYGKMRFEKGRQFSRFEKIVVQGIEYSTAKFQDAYLIMAYDQNDNYSFHQNTYYAKNIGMVKYVRTLPNGDIKILELESILLEEEFEKLKKV